MSHVGERGRFIPGGDRPRNYFAVRAIWKVVVKQKRIRPIPAKAIVTLIHAVHFPNRLTKPE